MSVITLQPDETSGKDTFVYHDLATTNFDTQNIQVGRDPSASLAHGLIQFDLSSIPGDATITSVVLTLKTTATVRNTPTVDVYRILVANSAWTETGATWNTKDGAAGWAGSAGASTSGTDYSTTLMAQTLINATTTAFDFTLDLTEFALMQASNNGMLLKGDNEASNNDAVFSDATDATSGNRPKLTITYTQPSGVSSGYSFVI